MDELLIVLGAAAWPGVVAATLVGLAITRDQAVPGKWVVLGLLGLLIGSIVWALMVYDLLFAVR